MATTTATILRILSSKAAEAIVLQSMALAQSWARSNSWSISIWLCTLVIRCSLLPTTRRKVMLGVVVSAAAGVTVTHQSRREGSYCRHLRYVCPDGLLTCIRLHGPHFSRSAARHPATQPVITRVRGRLARAASQSSDVDHLQGLGHAEYFTDKTTRPTRAAADPEAAAAAARHARFGRAPQSQGQHRTERSNPCRALAYLHCPQAAG